MHAPTENLGAEVFRDERRRAHPGTPATDAQKSYIAGLSRKLGRHVPSDAFLERLTTYQASLAIDDLKRRQEAPQKPVEARSPIPARFHGAIPESEIRATLARWGVPWPPPKGWLEVITKKDGPGESRPAPPPVAAPRRAPARKVSNHSLTSPASVPERTRRVIPQQFHGAVSAYDIEAGRSKRGGWKRKTLARWGVPWPPPSGWRKLITKPGDLKESPAITTERTEGLDEPLHSGPEPPW